MITRLLFLFDGIGLGCVIFRLGFTILLHTLKGTIANLVFPLCSFRKHYYSVNTFLEKLVKI